MASESGLSTGRLLPLIERKAARHGTSTPLDGLMLHRFSHPSEPLAFVQHPAYCVVVQGAKEAMVGCEVVRYTAGQSLIAGVDLPITSRIVEASPAEPYLAIGVALDFAVVLELIGDQPHPPPAEEVAPFGVRDFDPELADPLVRLLELLDRPQDIAVLAPLIRREIVWRLLKGPFSTLMRQLAWPEGHIARICRATQWIRENYSETLRIADLAERVNMSVPSFHRHFKKITTVSPLQFQKRVRLHLARGRLLASEAVGMVAYDVGYESLSQFNRDYRKLYGMAPTHDVAVLRQGLGTAPATSGLVLTQDPPVAAADGSRRARLAVG